MPTWTVTNSGGTARRSTAHGETLVNGPPTAYFRHYLRCDSSRFAVHHAFSLA
jgi:hypothetical protein